MTMVFDGHNDVLLRLLQQGDKTGASFIRGNGGGHLDLPRARQGGFAGGLFAMFTPAPDKPGGILNTDPVEHGEALKATEAMFSVAEHLAADHPDDIRICRNVSDIHSASTSGQMAMMLHIEGAEAIRPDLSNLDVFYDRGLRSLGPAWSRPNAFAHGVPFVFPSSPDIGPGLTPEGKELVKACLKKHIMIDLSHMNEAGFWDIEKLSSAPLVATHSNIHQICAASRNLTDHQLDAIAASNGLVGINFAVGFLRPDGQKNPDMPVEVIIQHLDYLITRLGENGIALGSDFDGTEMPTDLSSAKELPHLVNAMEKAGFGKELIHRICFQNWIDMIAKVIG